MLEDLGLLDQRQVVDVVFAGSEVVDCVAAFDGGGTQAFSIDDGRYLELGTQPFDPG